MKSTHLPAWALAALSILFHMGPTQAATPPYQAALLPVEANGWAFGISESGVIAGAVQSRSDFTGYAATWDALSNPVTIGGAQTSANAINVAGHAAGVTYTGVSTVHATVWKDGVAHDLGAPRYNSAALAINASGQVAGWSGEDFRCCNVATVWDSATSQARTLSTLQSAANAINASGQVAGFRFVDGYTKAALWSGSEVLDLGADEATSVAFGINDAGQVVGVNTVLQSGEAKSMLWHEGRATELASLSQRHTSAARDINNHGWVVGYSAIDTGYLHAALWIGSEVIDLNAYLDPSLLAEGWYLKQANAINDEGWIVGVAEKVTNGETTYRGFLISPVPEPSSFATVFLGLVLMVGLMRIRRAAASTL